MSGTAPARPLYRLWPALLLVLGLALAPAAAQVRVATDAAGRPLSAPGRIVLVEPDIELSLVTAGGLREPQREWSDTARRLLPEAARRWRPSIESYPLPPSLAPASRLGQIVRLHQAVAFSIAAYSQPGSELATKGKQLDWTLGPGVVVLREATGADYALFVLVRDSYASAGRQALRVFGFLAGAAMGSYLDIGGGMQLGVATLIDLRSGQVVWFNLMQRQTGDLREPAGADQAVRKLFEGLPQ